MSNHRYLYKYLPFDPKGALKVITESTIKFTHPNEFNDPFDCAPFIDTAKITPDSIKPLQKEAHRSPAQRLENKTKDYKSIKSLIEDGSYLKQINDGFGICSLSRNGSDILMWSHYAKGITGKEDHEGFLVEFELPNKITQSMEQKADLHLISIQVVYGQTRPEFDPINSKKEQALPALTSKSEDWSYEEEERVFSQGPGIKPISSALVCSVIAGMRMKEQEFKILEEAVNEHNRRYSKSVRLFRAKAHLREYRIVVDDHPRLCE